MTSCICLVEKGPVALPFLLEALGDKTPSKLKVVRRTDDPSIKGALAGKSE
jgi:hypothetical protein